MLGSKVFPWVVLFGHGSRTRMRSCAVRHDARKERTLSALTRCKSCLKLLFRSKKERFAAAGPGAGASLRLGAQTGSRSVGACPLCGANRLVVAGGAIGSRCVCSQVSTAPGQDSSRIGAMEVRNGSGRTR